ncbi:hypothetical protein CPB86DRAFT_778560 [Serendipita vermifera]|nr:hypothetical protein CPB86DRAFT_778560 [Serendipita vermifera]
MSEHSQDYDPLPAGWERRKTSEGTTYYADHNAPYYYLDPSYICSLPLGWEQRRIKEGRVYFVNHNTQTTTWFDPRRDTTLNVITGSVPKE